MATRRETLGVNLTPMVKLVKRWNRTHSSHFGSYQIEVMTASMFATLSSNHRNAVEVLLRVGAQLLRRKRSSWVRRFARR